MREKIKRMKSRERIGRLGRNNKVKIRFYIEFNIFMGS